MNLSYSLNSLSFLFNKILFLNHQNNFKTLKNFFSTLFRSPKERAMVLNYFLSILIPFITLEIIFLACWIKCFHKKTLRGTFIVSWKLAYLLHFFAKDFFALWKVSDETSNFVFVSHAEIRRDLRLFGNPENSFTVCSNKKKSNLSNWT